MLLSVLPYHRKFADGFPDLFVEDAINIRNRHVALLASFHNPSVIFEQISVMYALPRLFVSSFTLVLPFFPTGTMERVRCQLAGRHACFATLCAACLLLTYSCSFNIDVLEAVALLWPP